MNKIITAFKLLSKYLLQHLFFLVPIQQNKVVFSSFRGKQYGESPMHISNILESSNLDIVWILDEHVDSSSNIRRVCPNTLKEIYELSTAKVWVDNCRKDMWIRKRKGQYYVQTWHGNIALKKIEKDAEDKLSGAYVASAKHDSQMVDLFISGSRWQTDLYRKSFWYSGEIIEAGCPRSDIFYISNNEKYETVRDFYSISKETKIVLYAPTFRQDKRMDCYDMDYESVISCLEQFWGGDWVMLIRLHPNLSSMHNFIHYNEKILNGSLYQDISDLVISSNLLITDYSTCMFDAMEAGRPAILYASDMEQYKDERGMYFSFNELPFPLAETNDQLQNIIKNFSLIEYADRTNSFMSELGIVQDGRASKITAEKIIEQLGNSVN